MQTPFYQKVFEIVNIFSFSVGIFGRFFIGMPISAGSRYHDELIFTAVRIAAFTMLSQHSKSIHALAAPAYYQFRIIRITFSPFRSPS
jgi:hypothetical protein